MNGPSAALVKANAQESLWQFLLALPTTVEAQAYFLLCITGLAGLAFNWWMRFVRNEIEGGLIGYLFQNNVKRTMLSLTSIIGGALVLVYNGGIEVQDGVYMGWKTIAGMGFGAGYALDNSINKGARKEWSEEERNSQQKIDPPKQEEKQT